MDTIKKQRKSKNAELYEKLRSTPENNKYIQQFDTKEEAETFRRTVLIWLKRQLPNTFTSSVNPTEEGKIEVVFFNFPKQLPETS